MLQLARRKGETIIINDSIFITVVEIKGKVVRLGIEFPKDVRVLRKELYERIQEENRQARDSTLEIEDIVRSVEEAKANESHL